MLETLRAYGLDRLVATGEHEAAAAMITSRFDALTYRDLIELRGWAEELAGDPAAIAHPRATALLGIAAEAAYHRGDLGLSERRAGQGLELATDTEDAWCCLMPLAVVHLARGAYAAVIEYCLAPAAFAPHPRENYGLAALTTAYGGDPETARTLNDRGLAEARSPTMLAWAAYVTGKIETYAGHRKRAEPHYVRAVELARGSGATFIVGVATVGLLAARAEAGQVHDALRGYREVIDYFARTGNWPHLWVTLRNLADLLRRLGDDEPAALLHAAADRAPDAPAVDGAGPGLPATTLTPVPGPEDVLELARRAIDRNLPIRTGAL
jgi:tetratricopeptide (TPR) repeat protein